MLYYGTKISDNLSRREPEGYLLCLNVPVARTGVQEYLPEELGLDLSSFSLPGNEAAGEPKGTETNKGATGAFALRFRATGEPKGTVPPVR